MTTPSNPQPKTTSSNAAALIVAIGILLSRIAGLVRSRVFAHYLGNSDAAGAFTAALRIPNFLQNLFGEGVLSASFIPVYSRLRSENDMETARRVAGVVGAVLAVTVSILVLVGVGLTPFFVDLVAPGFHGELRLLTIHIVQVLFPGVGLLVLSAWCLGILNSHRKFFISYVAPVLWNAAMIATLLVWGRSSTQSDLALKLAWGSVLGSFLQFAIQVPFIVKYAGRIPFRITMSLHPVREVFRNLGPVLISRGVVQLSAYIDGMIASFLGAAAVASLGYAQTIYLLPISLFGMAVAAAELPEMSASAGTSDEAKTKLRARIVGGRRRIAFFVIPSAAAFLFLGRSVIAALYQTGQFGPEDTRYAWYILIGSVVGLLAATWGRLYSSAFYALRDTRRPLVFALIRVSLTIVLGLLFAFPLRPYINLFFEKMPGLGLPKLPGIDLSLGAVGLTASAGLAGWIEFICLARSLANRIGPITMPKFFTLRVWVAAITAAGLALAFDHFALPPSTRLDVGHYDVRPLLVIAVFGVAYLVLTILLKVEEGSAFLRKLRRAR